jgi:hypothetical protein
MLGKPLNNWRHNKNHSQNQRDLRISGYKNSPACRNIHSVAWPGAGQATSRWHCHSFRYWPCFNIINNNKLKLLHWPWFCIAEEEEGEDQIDFGSGPGSAEGNGWVNTKL